jgi:hypothetical protein
MPTKTNKIKNINLQLKEAIRLLRDLAELQNGSPLATYEKEWNKTMEDVWEFIDDYNTNKNN